MYLEMRRNRQEYILVIPAPQDDQALPELRYAVVYRIQNAMHRMIAYARKLLQHNIQDGRLLALPAMIYEF